MIGRGDIIYGPAFDRVSWRDGALWTAAGFAMLCVHVGAAAWAMRDRPPMPMQEAAPAAIMVELAPEIVAPQAEEQSIAVDSTPAEDAPDEPAEEAAEPEEEPVVEPEPEPLPEPVSEEAVEETVEEIEPEEEVVEEPEPDPVQQFVEAQLENVEVPIPVKRPPPPKPKVEKPQPAEKPVRRPKPSKPSRQSAPAQVQADHAPRAAAPTTSRGMTSSVSPARWQSRLLAHLERRKRYPSGAKSRREQGTAYVRFSIDASGNVLSVRLARSSGFPELDQEVVAMVRRASPVPPPPPGVNREITVPVRFSVR